jgi:hypothetical protein
LETIPLQAHLAGVLEDDGALRVLQVLVQAHPVGSCAGCRQCRLADFDRLSAKVRSVQFQQVEGVGASESSFVAWVASTIFCSARLRHSAEEHGIRNDASHSQGLYARHSLWNCSRAPASGLCDLLRPSRRPPNGIDQTGPIFGYPEIVGPAQDRLPLSNEGSLSGAR